MAEQNKESSMEEILSSIKRIIAEDKSVEIDRPSPRQKPRADKPVKAGSEDSSESENDEVLELTNELPENVVESKKASAHGVFGDRRRDGRLIDDQKLDSMRQSLSALVAMEGANSPPPAKQSDGTSLQDLTREMMRPMLKTWLDENLPQLVEELVAREIQRISRK